MSCKQGIEPENASQAKARSYSGAKTIENTEASRFTYFFYVNGVKHERGQFFEVRAGQRFYVELRFIPINFPQSAFTMDKVTRWDIPQNNIRLVRQYTPEGNNANEYEVIAPNILDGDHLNLGTITAYFSAFPGTSDFERRPVTLSLFQSGGGIVGVAD